MTFYFLKILLQIDLKINIDFTIAIDELTKVIYYRLLSTKSVPYKK